MVVTMLSLLDRSLSWLMTVLAAVPATFWGVVVGSFFTLLGGYVTNCATDRRQRGQFLHEQTLKREERELALRKDIYLAAADAIQEGAGTLVGLANLDIAIGEITKAYVGKAPAIAKVQVIARGETLSAVAAAAGFLTAAILRLTARRLPLDLARRRLDALRAEVAGFETERDRWLEEMKRYNLAGVPNERLWDTLRRNYGFEDRRVGEAHARIAGQMQELFTRQLDLTAGCLAEARQLAAMMVPAVLAVRGELGIPSDGREIRTLMDTMLAKQKAATDAFLEAARAAVANPALPPSTPDPGSAGGLEGSNGEGA